MGDHAMSSAAELLFIDPDVLDQETIHRSLRVEIEPIYLDRTGAPAGQIARALRGRSGVAAVHVMAHGEPGRVRFAAGAWTGATRSEDAPAFADIGAALEPEGAIALWSCSAAAGRDGRKLVTELERATGVVVAAASTPVGSEALGGGWTLARGSRSGPPIQAPLRANTLADYRALLAVQITVSGTIPTGPTQRNVTYFVLDRATNTVVGSLTLPDASTFASSFRLQVSIARSSNALDVGVFDDAGQFKSAGFVIEAPPAPLGAVGAS